MNGLIRAPATGARMISCDREFVRTDQFPTSNAQLPNVWELGIGSWLRVLLAAEENRSEPRRETESPDPALTRAFEWMRVIDLHDREIERVQPQADARAGHRLPIAADKRRLLAAVPCCAAIGEERHLRRYRSIHAAGRPEGTQQ